MSEISKPILSEHDIDKTSIAPEIDQYPSDIDRLLAEKCKAYIDSELNSASEIFDEYSAHDRHLMGSFDLKTLQTEHGLPSEYSGIIRDSSDINDYIMKRKEAGSPWLKDILEKRGITEINEDDIPEVIMNKVKLMMSFSLENGAETIDGIGMPKGFYHVHFVSDHAIEQTDEPGNRLADISNNMTGIIGHTQELNTFDIHKRSIIYEKSSDNFTILPGNEHGVVQAKDLGLEDIGGLHFRIDIDTGKLHYFMYVNQ
jgi:hypothetical protein